MPVHAHKLISDDGVSEIAISDEDFDRQWLRRQRLIDGPVAITYAGYFPYSRKTTPIEPAEIRYGGYVFEDSSGCPVCREENP